MFIIVFKIAPAGIVLRPARIPRTAVGLRQAKAGVTLAMGRRENFVASIPEPKAQLRLTDFHEGLARRVPYRPSPDRHQKSLADDESLGIRSVEEVQSRRPEIELPDADGFFAALILRLVRGVNRSGQCCTECQRLTVHRRPGSGSIIAGAAGTRRSLPAQKSLETAKTTWPNMVTEPLDKLLLVELAHRQAQVFAAEEHTS